MTDVFGNDVIQKFFDHGTLEHRRQLAKLLTGQVLSLSLQMYGCRVIQKALEVIEIEQKVTLVQEPDDHVMRCVHDQNGNHVIQKCIESIPANKIGFIISSFFGQVSALSSHPYGCRVIQRVLEHCSDEQINQSIVGEILESTCMLAQDPYGNYVTQHILEMGKPHERRQIIKKLAGKFIQMSQLKFSSNVVEKCLKHGDASERDLIIEEFISGPDNHDSLLMKVGVLVMRTTYLFSSSVVDKGRCCLCAFYSSLGPLHSLVLFSPANHTFSSGLIVDCLLLMRLLFMEICDS